MVAVGKVGGETSAGGGDGGEGEDVGSDCGYQQVLRCCVGGQAGEEVRAQCFDGGGSGGSGGMIVVSSMVKAV